MPGARDKWAGGPGFWSRCIASGVSRPFDCAQGRFLQKRKDRVPLSPTSGRHSNAAVTHRFL
jgi:hypothetical protein